MLDMLQVLTFMCICGRSDTSEVFDTLQNFRALVTTGLDDGAACFSAWCQLRPEDGSAGFMALGCSRIRTTPFANLG
jgi:hypothetical protein